ncbi:MAG: AAA family ATPase [Firmicutes bacterium]|nr:AAA family ATPase [Bacillota bacterium]
MKLLRIYFKSFGILREQTMEEIHPGLVIIAGPNRAGKTTFMTALRYLGYGLPRKDFIPPSLTGQHDYNADVELMDRSRYNIHILGNSKPKVSPLGSWQEIEIADIFHDLDGFTYRQVFTISLDELRRIPEGLAGKEEQNLQVVLLGGGWVDALRLEKFKAEFDKLARPIGASKGAKNVAGFKTYVETIKEGIEERNEANKQSETYYEKKQELTKLDEETIPRMKKDLQDLQMELETLEIIKDHYDKYEKFLLLGEKLKRNDHLWKTYPEGGHEQAVQLREEYIASVDEYEKIFREYSAAAGEASPDIFLEKEDALLGYQKDLSGWREKVAGYRENKQNYLDEKKVLKQKLGQLNEKWGHDLTVLDEIAVDLVNKANLRESVDKYRKAADKKERIPPEKALAQDSLDTKIKEKKQLIEEDRPRAKNLFHLAGLALIAVLLAVFINPAVSLGVGFILAAAIYVYYQSHQSKEKEHKSQLVLVDKEIDDLRKQLDFLTVEETALQEILNTVGEELNQAVKQLKLPSNTPFFQLVDFYGEITNLKERYGLWLKRKEKLDVQYRELEEIFEEITLVLGSLIQGIPDIDKDFSVSEKIFAAVEKAVDHLGLAQELKRADTNKAKLQEKIIALLLEENPELEISLDMPPAELLGMLNPFISRGKRYEELKKEAETYENINLDLKTSLNIEKRKKTLLRGETEKDVLLAYDQHFSAYSSLEEIERKYGEIAGQEEILERQKRSALEKRTILETEVQYLSSDEKLQAAHQKISTAKDKLEILAERYATYRLAEFLLDGVHKTFIKNTKGSILNSAGDIFEKITSGDYKQIDMPTEQTAAVSILDFKVKQAGIENPQASFQLSRATKEQLFLSVRLSRIRNIKPLPVIFDDSLVNFDPAHSRQAARLIAKMAETHQVFVLTCHPEFIKHLQEQAASAQHWCLDNGKINGPFATPAETISLLNP